MDLKAEQGQNTFMDEEESLLQQESAKLSNTNPGLAHQIPKLYCQKSPVSDMIRDKLDAIQESEHYTGVQFHRIRKSK